MLHYEGVNFLLNGVGYRVRVNSFGGGDGGMRVVVVLLSRFVTNLRTVSPALRIIPVSGIIRAPQIPVPTKHVMRIIPISGIKTRRGDTAAL